MPLFAEEGIWVDAGALMSYATNEIDAYRLLATYVDKILKKARSTGRSAADEVRVHHQSQSCQANRFHDSAERAGAGG